MPEEKFPVTLFVDWNPDGKSELRGKNNRGWILRSEAWTAAAAPAAVVAGSFSLSSLMCRFTDHLLCLHFLRCSDLTSDTL